jgi:predicted transcriptional regulator
MKREKLQIIHDILSVLMKKGGSSRPTHILYKANLSYAMMDQYLNELVKKGLVIVRKQDEVKIIALTDQGYQYLQNYQKVKSFMDTFGLDDESEA